VRACGTPRAYPFGPPLDSVHPSPGASRAAQTSSSATCALYDAAALVGHPRRWSSGLLTRLHLHVARDPGTRSSDLGRPGPARLPLPRSEVELLQRADALAGRRLADIAAEHGVVVPPDLRHHKGWVGDLIETALGARGAGRAGPDLPELGIEIKSIPVNQRGRPRQSTWVCSTPMGGSDLGPWSGSPVRAKLRRVLWMAIAGDGPPGERWIGAPILWSPTAAQEELLATDWEVLAELVSEGLVWQWKAQHGKALQIRPKAARGDDWVWVIDQEAEWVRTVPLGLYLRASFTARVLATEPRLLTPR